VKITISYGKWEENCGGDRILKVIHELDAFKDTAVTADSNGIKDGGVS
jgi:hypothetical protein